MDKRQLLCLPEDVLKT